MQVFPNGPRTNKSLKQSLSSLPKDDYLKYSTIGFDRGDVGIMRGFSCAIDARSESGEQTTLIPNIPFFTKSQRRMRGNSHEREQTGGRSFTPRRLDLNGLELNRCPILEHQDRLQLLSLQSNNISDIGNLNIINGGLVPQLLYLDLYDNRIEDLPAALNSIVTLKVLMLGKNRIFHINNNLEQLHDLHVLDMHSNFISLIENIPKSLRVLKLSGNKIKKLENLSLNEHLIELDLGKNSLMDLGSDLQLLKTLKCLLLPKNKLRLYSDLEQISLISQLSELSLEGNPFCKKIPFEITGKYEVTHYFASHRHILYRAFCLHMFQQADLQRFDMRVVTSEERERVEAFFKLVNNYMDKRGKCDGTKIDNIMESALNMFYTGGKHMVSGNIQVIKNNELGRRIYENNNEIKDLTNERKNGTPSNLSPFSNGKSNIIDNYSSSKENYRVVFSSLQKFNEIGHYEVQVPTKNCNSDIEGSVKAHEVLLHVYDRGWGFLSDYAPWIISTCNHLVIKKTSLEDSCKMMNLIRKRLPNLVAVTFIQESAYAINNFDACRPLCVMNDLPQSDNPPFFVSHKINFISPVTNLALFREFFAYFLPDLYELNGIKVSEMERERGRQFFRALFPVLMRQSNKESKRRRQKELRRGSISSTGFPYAKRTTPQVSAKFKKTLIGHAGHKKGKVSPFTLLLQIAHDTVHIFINEALHIVTSQLLFEQSWPEVVEGIIRETLSHIDHLDTYTGTCLDSLSIQEKY